MATKCLPAIVIVILVLSLLWVILLTYVEYKSTTKRPSRIDSHNNSKCYSQYSLEDSVRVSVCKLSESEKLVDIRVFIKDKPTIKGIQLRPHQWKNLLSYSGLIAYRLQNGP